MKSLLSSTIGIDGMVILHKVLCEKCRNAENRLTNWAIFFPISEGEYFAEVKCQFGYAELTCSMPNLNDRERSGYLYNLKKFFCKSY